MRSCLVVSSFFLAAIAAFVGCGGKDSGGEGGSGPGSTGAGAVCYSVPVNTTNDGASACGPMTCTAGQYCLSNVGICDPGCINELTCGARQTCDTSNGTKNPNGDVVGLCRAPTSAETVPCQGASSSSGGSDCQPRCLAKAASCGAPSDVATQKCTELCATATEDQVTCLEGKSCMEIGDAFSHGTLICGL
jgi:hypothetical protein